MWTLTNVAPQCTQIVCGCVNRQRTIMPSDCTTFRAQSIHISNICKRGGSTFCFLRRNLRNSPQECRRLAYISLIRSSLEYGATVWDPYLKQDVDRLERVQCQAARFIKSEYRTRETTAGTQEAAAADKPLQACEGPHPSHASRELPDASRQKQKKNTPDRLQGL